MSVGGGVGLLPSELLLNPPIDCASYDKLLLPPFTDVAPITHHNHIYMHVPCPRGSSKLSKVRDLGK